MTGTVGDTFAGDATFFDGLHAEPHAVRLFLSETGTALVFEAAGTRHAWPVEDIRDVPDIAGGDLTVLQRRGDPLARLLLADTSALPPMPRRTRRVPTPHKGRIARWAAAAIGSVAVIIFVLVPLMADQLARFIPPEGERALGEVTLGQIRRALGSGEVVPVAFCEAPRGLAALGTIRTRLASGTDLPQELSVHVLDHEMVNAFALPGGYVVLFRGLLEAAETPEEIAAVLAHEVGHVVSRDPTRHALRSAGSIGVLGLIFGDFAGGAAVLFLTERLIEARYSRAAETAADAFAHDMLEAADISPAALARMFDRFREIGGEVPSLMTHFLSHPDLDRRMTAAENAVPPGFSASPLLSDSDFRALQAICG